MIKKTEREATMRKTLLILTLIVLFIMSGISAAVFAFVEIAPIHPEGKLFQMQDHLEHAMLVFYINPTSKSWYELKILDKRVKGLDNIAGKQEEAQHINNVWVELDHVLKRFQDGNSDDIENLRLHFVKTLSTIQKSMNQFIYLKENFPIEFSLALEELNQLKILAENDSNPLSGLYVLNQALMKNDTKVSSLLNSAPERQDTIDPRKIPFLPGSTGANHQFFPLMGKHAELTCEGCHSGLTYEGLPDQCVECHLAVLPDNHYQGVCSLCHTATGWVPTFFNHSVALATDCQSCHLVNKPANHFSGQCSSCHSTTAWIPASFDHAIAGATNCQSCHNKNKPTNHFSGQCSACHSINAWIPASFNHAIAGATDCQSCHSGNKPANHFSGQCSACHSTNVWRPASFNHAAMGATDCQGCHSGNKPANHFSGQCSACHSTNAWRPASFNHAAIGATDCQGCHSGNKPANHFAGQCSDCHSTDSWGGANFSHSFPLNHGDANGECAQCHPSGGSSWTCFNCHSQSKMTEKHVDKGIPDYVTRCMECHGNGKKNDD
ncbi:MAG: hypothetical protein BGO78_09205 [Chloroflexi bacterium 44-23]|nr:MAG: hypothetical protein BGO78_09205 [Chloroflexi bacterium 44-23]